MTIISICGNISNTLNLVRNFIKVGTHKQERQMTHPSKKPVAAAVAVGVAAAAAVAVEPEKTHKQARQKQRKSNGAKDTFFKRKGKKNGKKGVDREFAGNMSKTHSVEEVNTERKTLSKEEIIAHKRAIRQARRQESTKSYVSDEEERKTNWKTKRRTFTSEHDEYETDHQDDYEYDLDWAYGKMYFETMYMMQEEEKLYIRRVGDRTLEIRVSNKTGYEASQCSCSQCNGDYCTDSDYDAESDCYADIGEECTCGQCD